ncbi:PEGA domain-containing protein, partial [Myxococcota bacterium]|nr:PEGA domain-containing protein [Myxococcota bacterium]
NFNLAQCHRQLRQWEKAVFFYKRFVSALPEAEQVEHARRFIQEGERALAAERLAREALRRKQLGRVTVITRPPGAVLYLDAELEKPRGTTPLKLDLLQGEHRVLLRREGHARQVRRFTVRRDTNVSLTTELVPLPKPRWLPPLWSAEFGIVESFCFAGVCRLDDEGGHDGLLWMGIGVAGSLVRYWYRPGEREVNDTLPVRKFVGTGVDFRWHTTGPDSIDAALTGFSLGGHARLGRTLGWRALAAYALVGAGYGYSEAMLTQGGAMESTHGAYFSVGAGFILTPPGLPLGLGFQLVHQLFFWDRAALAHDTTWFTFTLARTW